MIGTVSTQQLNRGSEGRDPCVLPDKSHESPPVNLPCHYDPRPPDHSQAMLQNPGTRPSWRSEIDGMLPSWMRSSGRGAAERSRITSATDESVRAEDDAEQSITESDEVSNRDKASLGRR